MFDLFISYKSEERMEALHVKRYLEANGLTCWMDQEQIKIGDNYETDIAAIMPQCRSLVLLLSFSSQLSKEVQVEYEQARKNGLAVYPLKIEECSLASYYDRELKHTQVANEYWKSEKNKLTVLNTVRDKIYELKGEPVKTAEDFLKMRVDNYQRGIKKEYLARINDWDNIVEKSVERCGFMTPEPHFMRGVIIGALENYQDMVDTYIEDIVISTDDMEYLIGFYHFILSCDLITETWISYDRFEKLALEGLPYLSQTDANDPVQDCFLLRMYKDYLIVLDSEGLIHPIVKLCERLYGSDVIKYELFISEVQDKNQPAFVEKASMAAYVHPRYIGSEYISINWVSPKDDHRNVFRPTDITPPHWTDFLRRFTCDILLDQLKKSPGASTLTTFFLDNSFFTSDKKLNYMYLYLIDKWIECGHPEYVKIFLRNAGLINWNYNVSDSAYEIALLKRFIFVCMWENGFEHKDIKQLWLDA